MYVPVLFLVALLLAGLAYVSAKAKEVLSCLALGLLIVVLTCMLLGVVQMR